MRWVALFVLLCPLVASAHAILIDSEPAPNGTLPAGQHALVLKFNSRIDRARSRLALVAAGKPEQRLDVADSGPADVMVAPAYLSPGEYTIKWQVLAVDGHITRGDVPFTVTDPLAAFPVPK